MNENELLKRLLALNIELSSMPFNLMSIMYENVYRKEETQSSLIAGLLDPQENHKFGDILIKQFFNEIGIDKNFEEIKDIVVKTERIVKEIDENNRRIDILITFNNNNEKHAIIIENKIYNAKEQKNQLDDYCRRIENEGYIVDKIIFIPLYESYKPTASKETKEKIVILDTECLIKWLENCIEIVKKDNIEHSALVQYKEFFECLIDKNKNIMEIQKIINEFSPSEINKLEEIANLINKESWIEERFKFIVDSLDIKVGLIIKYKRNKNGDCCYAQFYFNSYEFWVELWLKEKNIEFYLVSETEKVGKGKVIKKGEIEFESDGYNWDYRCCYYKYKHNFDYPKNAEDDNMRKIKEVLLPILDELEDYAKTQDK